VAMTRRTKIKYFAGALILSTAFFLGVLVHKRDAIQREAIQSCLKDLENNCPGVFRYAVMLETENSRLNKRLAECRKEAKGWKEDASFVPEAFEGCREESCQPAGGQLNERGITGGVNTPRE